VSLLLIPNREASMGYSTLQEAINNMRELVRMSDEGNDLGSQGGPWLGEIEEMRETLRILDSDAR